MSIAGMRVGLKATTALMDTVVGLKDGSVFRQTHTDLATQLMSAGPLANLLATTSGNVVFFATEELLLANVDYVAPQAAWVFADPNPQKNGSYYFTDGDPGFWTFMLGFPNSWLFATVSGGTANAIELTASASAGTSTMIFFVPTANCAAGGVTVSINGGDALDLLDVRGDELLADAIVTGGLVAFFPTGDGAARSVIDTTATAAAAAAAASAVAAGISAGNAGESATQASGSATQAQKYAQNPEDEEISPGSGLYSAYHWSLKAAAIVVNGMAAWIVAATTKAIPVAADVFAYVDDASGELRRLTWTNMLDALSDTFAKVLNPYTDVAVAGTINVGALTGKPKRLNLTGSSGPITSFGTGASLGYSVRCRVQDGGFPITNSANIVCLGGADIPCAAGDVFDVDYVSADKWVIVNYTKADGTPIGGGGLLELVDSGDFSGDATLTISGITTDTVELIVKFRAVLPTADAAGLVARVSTDGTSFDFGASDYVYVWRNAVNSGSGQIGAVAAYAVVVQVGTGGLSNSAASDKALNATVRVSNMADATKRTELSHDINYRRQSDNQYLRGDGSAKRDNKQADTAIQFFLLTGSGATTFASGSYEVYALKRA